MLQLFYGPDALSIDRYYLKFKEQFSEIETIDQLDARSVEEKLSTTGFFTENKLFVLKNIFLNQIRVGKVSKNLTDVLGVINRFLDQNLLFIEEDPKKLKYYQQFFPKIKSQEFKQSPKLFAYLDSFKPGNLNECYRYWQASLELEAPELVYFMLKRRIRELIAVRGGNLKGNYQPWYLGKLKSQSDKFDSKKLERIYHSLFNFELGQKTGTQPLKVAQALETIMVLHL